MRTVHNNRVDPGSEEAGVKDVGLEARALRDCPTHNRRRSRRKLHTTSLSRPPLAPPIASHVAHMQPQAGTVSAISV